jgi:hypothetical protein
MARVVELVGGPQHSTVKRRTHDIDDISRVEEEQDGGVLVRLDTELRVGLRRRIDDAARKRVRCNYCGQSECDCRNVNTTPLVVSSMERGKAKSTRRWTDEELLRAVTEVAAMARPHISDDADPRSRKTYDLYRTAAHPTSHTIIARFGEFPKKEGATHGT